MSQEVIHHLPLDRLETMDQVRREFDEPSIAGLSASLGVGMLQPIRARKEGDKLIVVDGERRLRAARLAKLETVPVIIEDQPLSEATILLKQLVANCQRADLLPLEKADAIDKLMRTGSWQAAQVAAKLGMSVANVSNLLALRTLPEPVRQAVNTGRIAASAAYELTRIEDEAKRTDLTEKLLAGKLTRDGLVAISKRCRQSTGDANSSPISRATAQLATNRTISVAAAELSLERFIDLLEELLSKARKARTQGLELGTFIKMLRDQARTA